MLPASGWGPHRSLQDGLNNPLESRVPQSLNPFGTGSKPEAVAQAERELDGKGWLPSPLLTPGAVQSDAADREHVDAAGEAPMAMAAE